MRKFKFKVYSDIGVHFMSVSASSEKEALRTICEDQKCPDHAAVLVRVTFEG